MTDATQDGQAAFFAFRDAFEAGDLAGVRSIVQSHPDLLKDGGRGSRFMRKAAEADNVEMVALFAELGEDIHAPDGHGDPPAPEGVITYAAMAGSLNVVSWLLDQGARINFTMPEFFGESRCMPLTQAVTGGHLEVVKLLVERGANINALWGPFTPLTSAIAYRKPDIEAYLRSKGALEAWQVKGEPPPGPTDPVLRHVHAYLGNVEPLALHEIVPGDPPVSLFLVPPSPAHGRKHQTLVTKGVSDRPLNVPPGQEAYRYAELFINLPADWPLTEDAWRDPDLFWPIDRLRRLARFLLDSRSWPGGPVVVLSDDDPPQPLAPKTRQTCLMLAADADSPPLGRLPLAGGRTVVFYGVHPLYTEERDLEKRDGFARLFKLFDQYKIDLIVDPNRPNVARLAD